jgi:hypothetical protein
LKRGQLRISFTIAADDEGSLPSFNHVSRFEISVHDGKSLPSADADCEPLTSASFAL